ncbi:teleost multiple tissue opsin 2b [Oncorhynchus tshawytscha]|uniref:G-protein coupled receptors family 1 profile domain-containing protein n=1 Tax=Oncorhynchus tshawytscha TaxID=74940 RepID=A0AAZ3PI42_ONCTS|nr:teleost multiple tissue opsin 2b [Oncorhynchus tshawytscha]
MFSDLAGLNYTYNVSDDPFRFLDREWRDDPKETLSRTGFIVLSVFLGLIMTFGFLNNFVVLLLFCKFKTLRTPVNMLLLNISVSDMLVCTFGTTLSFTSSIKGKWLLGRHGCLWYGFINSCFGIVSLISLVVLSYDRYSTLTVYNKRGPDYRKPLLAVGGSWLYSLIWTVPPLLGWSSYDLEGAGTSCSVSWTLRTAQSHAYIICLFVFCLGLPIVIMVYCYCRLLWAVKQVGKIRKTAARRREHHILFMVLTTVVCYILCWMPYGVVAMMATFGRPGIITPVAAVVPSLLAKSSTVINPIIYILMNKQFYRCFLILFRCERRSTENGLSSMPSKTTVIQLNRRVYSNTVACTAQVSTGIHNHGCSTLATERNNPPEVTS